MIGGKLNREMLAGKPVAKCKLCGDSIMGERYFDQLVNGKLKFLQTMRLKGLMAISKKGSQLIGVPFDADDKKEQIETLLFTHFTRKVTNKPHREIIKRINKERNKFKLEEVIEIDDKLKYFI